MKALALGLSVAMFGAQVSAVGNCGAFERSCDTACKTAADVSSKASCNPFSAFCSCPGSYTEDPDAAKQDAFCSAMRKNCETDMCGSADNISSFSCEKWTFNTQCMCLSKSSQDGGPLLDKDGEACVELFKKCEEDTCKGKGVTKNLCVSADDYECTCDDGTSTGRGELNGSEAGAYSSLALALGAVGTLLMQMLV